MLNKNFVKEDIINILSKKTGFTKNLSKKLVNDLIDILIQCIKSGSLNLKTIGSFKTIFKKQRIGRNPKTNQNYIISSRKSVIFTASRKILESINING